MDKIKCDIKYADGELRVELSGEIDHHTAKGLRERIDTAIFLYRAESVVLGLGGVGFMDSAGLGLILGRYAVARDLGGKVSVADPQPEVERILRLAGTDKLIAIKKSESPYVVTWPSQPENVDFVLDAQSNANGYRICPEAGGLRLERFMGIVILVR
jgi:stage II sporulation protein AA (anti-sigma F factor antagonist)